jgi:hypothetical protein
MYLSYSGHKSYKECPRQYWHRYVAKTKLETPDNRVNSLYGSTVGLLFELFYNERLWMKPEVATALASRVDFTLKDILAKEMKTGAVDWKDPKSNYKSLDALRKDVLDTIPRGIAIIRRHRLLGELAEAEVKLDGTIEGHMIGGRADFIMCRSKPHGDLIILDGKGSRHRDKYVDPQQLWWYAMLYRHHHGILPDRLGFVFWRQEPDSSLDWVGFDAASLDDLQQGVLSSIREIEDGKRHLSVLRGAEASEALKTTFPIQLGDKCRLCAYQPVCPEGKSFSTMRFKPTGDFDSGVEDFGF